jgi:CheY-like chemotaxis protein
VLFALSIGLLIGYACFNGYTGHTIEWSQPIEGGNHPIWHILVPLPVAMWCGMVFMFGSKKALIALRRNGAIKIAGSIAHEMRNPLGQIKYALERIGHLLPNSTANHAGAISNQTINDIYANITQGLISCKRGLQVIDITLHEVSNQTLHPNTFDYLSAAVITEKAIAEYNFDPPEQRNKVKLHVLNDFTFKINETAYLYIIFNIVRNALYYFKTHPNATITISIDHQKITITDTGPGIPEAMLNKLFKEFATTGKTNGTGLGLVYCYRTMQAFRGKISCESVVGQYTTFTLNFPTVTQKEIHAHTEEIFQQLVPFLINKRILVVDDEEIYATSIRHMLKDLACGIDTAKNGQVAIEMLKTNSYDLILMDLNMPGKDGYVVTEEIRSGIVPSQKYISIIAYTIESHDMIKIKTQKAGMNGFISKSCTQLELIKTLYRIIENDKQKKQAETDNHLAGKTILIADDELFTRQYLDLYASEWGMKTHHAESGQGVLNTLKKEPHIDAICMDMHMPLMSGVETAQYIRANSAYHDVIIIAISGNFSDESIEEAKAAGINDFMTKPPDQFVLKQKLIHLITARNQAKAAIPSAATT